MISESYSTTTFKNKEEYEASNYMNNTITAISISFM